jgi:hypothetical protein
MSEMPLYRTSFGRGFLAAGASPVLLLGPFLLLLAYWLALVARGYAGSQPAVLFQALALPPLGPITDARVLQFVLPTRAATWGLLAAFLMRALVLSALAAAIVDVLETGRVGRAAVFRALRATPIVLGGLIVSFVAGLFTQLAASAGGLGLGTLAFVVATAGTIHFLGFLPFVAVTERRGLGASMRRSIAGARTPGGRNFLLALLYVFVMFLFTILPVGSGSISAQPSVGSWVAGLAFTHYHVGFLATIGYRWLVVRHTVPEPAPPQRRRR